MTQSAAIASASELGMRYGEQVLLDGATLAIHEGERIGLVGRNGCGKSTFLKIVAGELKPDSGKLAHRKDLIIGYLHQTFELDESATVMENVLSGAKHITDLIEEYENLDAESNKSGDLLDKITHLDGWSLEQRAESLLNHLHAPAAENQVATLSGGEKRRVALCRALLARPDFLILDEPTNHLDTEAIEWLEVFLSRYKGACLFVTHDRYFLDRIATRMVELFRGEFISYQGNYTDYLLSRAERMATEELQEHKRQRFLKKELDWVRRAPKARGSKAKSRIDAYFEVADKDAPEQDLDVDLIIPPAPRLANKIIELRDVGMGFDGRRLFDHLDLDLEEGQRIGIVGRNGLGKSTLIKIMLGELQADRGTVEIGKRTQINYVDQNRLALDDSKSVWEDVGEGSEHVRLGEETISLRSYLKRFLFTDDRINTKIELLSGGERSRVLLAKILKRGGNVIVLDEPTNDLDLGTLRMLEEALTTYKGCVIAVSHDRYFLNRVCNGILAFEGDGVVKYNVGNYDYYLEKREERGQGEKASVAAGATESKQKKAQQPARKLKWAEEKELEGMEDVILAAEEEAGAMENSFAAADFYEKHKDDWKELEDDLAVKKKNIVELYARWEELASLKSAYEG
ncbi:MAG: ATP-binding cassette domain-containing protein [Verrucomicrobiales bacterium]|nr:ATP-binding cassette domain-containing protein [Verrucomicrobiales bacterium]